MNNVQKKVLAFGQGDNFILPTRARPALSGGRQAAFYFPHPQCWETKDGWKKSDKAFYPQQLDQCHYCGKKYADYDTEYGADNGDNGYIVYAAKCGVCENCAKSLAKNARAVIYPYITERYARLDNGRTVMVHEYSDGVVVEGVMSDDIKVKEL